ncbi:MAG: hypothetical protein FWG17_08080 [Desulfovibrionaceae bacterium]|nr:hypothetical protein [Desulfovibrionaceae bacterium]
MKKNKREVLVYGSGGGRTFTAWLEQAAAKIAEYERQGRAALNDEAAYRAIMREKALYLAGLYAEAQPYLQTLEEKKRLYPASRLQAFSASAEQALNLGSVFYMSALLFPGDHQPGELNELEKLALEMPRG